MRLAFFFENYVVGGGSKYVVDCLNAVLLTGHEVSLVSNKGALSSYELSQLAAPVEQHDVVVFERTQSTARWLGDSRVSVLIRKAMFFASPVLFTMNVLALWRHLGRLRPELVVSCNGGYPAAEAALAAIVAARLRKIPSILVFMSQPAPRRDSLPFYDRLLDRLVLDSVTKVVANSVGQGRALAALRGADADKIHTIYNGIPDTGVQERPPRSASGSLTLGLVCRLDPLKGVDFLLQAFAQISAKNDVCLDIVGDGSERAALSHLAAELGIADRVRFHGHLQGEAVSAVLASVDLYVFPSLWEGLPYAILEAMRAGLPIVSTDVGGIPEALENRTEGLLVPPRSVDSLVTAINELIVDPELASRLGRNARDRYEAMFSLDKMQGDFAALVAGML